MRLITPLLASLCLAQALSAQGQEAYLKPGFAGFLDQFGSAIAISGDTAVVGCPFDWSGSVGVNGDPTDRSAPNSGAAYVFVRTGSTWTQQAYLKASNTDAQDSFGTAVAISGDTIVVGADGEGSDADGVDGDQTDNSQTATGAAYVFVRTGSTWSQQAYLKAFNSDGFDGFGKAVAVSGDTIVVGAERERSNTTGVDGGWNNAMIDAGAAYVFTRTGSTWSTDAFLKASNTGGGDKFGSAVAISNDTIVVGAESEDSSATSVDGDGSLNDAQSSGAAYVFVRNGGVWSQEAYLKASNTGAADFFGGSVAVDGDSIVVGARGEDGSAGIDGADDDLLDDAGATYVFERSAGQWAQSAYLKPSTRGAGDLFGASVGISGGSIVIGASRETSTAAGLDAVDDNTGSNGGAAYVFERVGGTWVQAHYVKASNPDVDDRFGNAVAISSRMLVVGAKNEASNATGVNGNEANNSVPSAGAAYVFEVCGADDEFEDNDTCATAVPVPMGSSEDLLLLGNAAPSKDEDFFTVDVGPHDTLFVDLSFKDADGDIDLYLYQDDCHDHVSWLARGYTSTDDESVTWTNNTDAVQTYTIVVDAFGSGFYCNRYDMDVAICAGDAYEDNDSCVTAVPAPVGQVSGLNVSGPANAWGLDEDYFTVSVPAGQTLNASIWFAHAEGDLDLYLYDATSGCHDHTSWLARGFSPTDNEIVSWQNATGSAVDCIVVVDAYGAGFDLNTYDMRIHVTDGTGCPNAELPTITGETSSTSSFQIHAPTPTTPCLSAPVIMFGACSPIVLPVPPPIGCGLCGLGINPSWGTLPDGILIQPGLPPGFSFCVQAGCIAQAGCVDLSQRCTIVITP